MNELRVSFETYSKSHCLAIHTHPTDRTLTTFPHYVTKISRKGLTGTYTVEAVGIRGELLWEREEEDG